MGKFAPVYLTAVLEYLTAEVLEQAGIISKLLKFDRVTPQSIRLAIREDKGKFKCSSKARGRRSARGEPPWSSGASHRKRRTPTTP